MPKDDGDTNMSQSSLINIIIQTVDLERSSNKILTQMNSRPLHQHEELENLNHYGTRMSSKPNMVQYEI